MVDRQKKGRILICDQALHTLKEAVASLADEYEILTAQSGENTLTHAKSGPDLILLNSVLPDMDGLEVCRRLKADFRTRRIPIIMAIDSHAETSEIKAIEAGAADCIKKPFDSVVSRARIQNQLAFKTLQERLRKSMEVSERRIEAIVKTIPDIIYRLDQEGRILFISEAIRQYGYEPAELMGKSIMTIVHPEDRELATYRVNERRTGERSTKLLEIRLLTRAQDAVSFEIASTSEPATSTFQISAQGIYESVEPGPLFFIGTQGVARDITARKKAEAEKQRLEAQLYQSRKMEALGTLAGGIAHDFNNILFPIMGYSEMLLEDLPKGGRNHDYVWEIVRASARAGELIRQILTFSRQTDIARKPVKIQSIIKETLKLLRASIPTTIEIRPQIDMDCPPVYGDLTRIHQILINLCTNAQHAMKDKGGVLEISLDEIQVAAGDAGSWPDLEPGAYLTLKVRDTGCGMSETIKARALEPYFTTKNQDEGTGLGLAIVHGIVTEYGGGIDIQSRLDQGTTVAVYLPVADTGAAVRSLQPEDSMPLKGNARVLLVDDEQSIVKLEQEMLEKLGYRVTARTGSLDALEAFQADPGRFDLIISDMTMPNMTGLELIRQIRAVRADVPVILCSGFSDQVSREKIASLGIGGYLHKPVLKNDLARVVHKVLNPADPKDSTHSGIASK